MHGARCVERRLDDPPGLFDDVFTGESARLTRHGIVEQAFVRLAPFAQGGGEIDSDIDVLAVEIWPGRLGLQRERDAILRGLGAEPGWDLQPVLRLYEP